MENDILRTTLHTGQPVSVIIANERHRGTVSAIASGRILVTLRPRIKHPDTHEMVDWMWLPRYRVAVRTKAVTP